MLTTKHIAPFPISIPPTRQSSLPGKGTSFSTCLPNLESSEPSFKNLLKPDPPARDAIFLLFILLSLILSFVLLHLSLGGLPGGTVVKNQPAMQSLQKTRVWSLGWKDPQEEEMATHSSILAWRIPWTEEPGRPHSMASQKVRHNRAGTQHLSLWMSFFVCPSTTSLQAL